MTQHDRNMLVQSVRQRYDTITPFLTEQVRRVWAAAEAVAIGRRGNAIVAEATGISRTTLTKAKQELSQPPSLAEPRQRQGGGGRKKLIDTDPNLLRDL